jgi:hypothetical protein
MGIFDVGMWRRRPASDENSFRAVETLASRANRLEFRSEF